MTDFRVWFTGLLCFAVVETTFADGYTSQTTESINYTSQDNPVTTAPSTTQHHSHKKHRDDQSLSISINVAEPVQQYIQRETTHSIMPAHGRHHGMQDMAWVSASQGARLPRNLISGGYQSHPPATFYVCRAFYRGGVHPGKLYDGACNFSWGGNEIISASNFEVLTSRRALSWVPASYGRIPPRAIEGGHQHDGQLFICQARYRGGMHPGKLYKEACLIAWGGKEIAIPEYYVLTR